MLQCHRTKMGLAIALAAAISGCVLSDERIDLPWNVLADVQEPLRQALRYQTPYHWATAYAMMAAVLVGMSFMRTCSRDAERSAE